MYNYLIVNTRDALIKAAGCTFEKRQDSRCRLKRTALPLCLQATPCCAHKDQEKRGMTK